MNPVWPVAALVAASALWGTMWWPLKQLNGLGIDGIPLTLVAYLAVAIPLVPVIIVQRKQWRGEGRYLFLILLVGGYSNLAFTTAMIYGEVVRVMVLFYLLPVWGVLGGRIFLGEHIDRARWLAVIMALAGGFVVLGGFNALKGEFSWLDLVAVTCGMAFAGNNLLFRARQAIPVPSKIAAMLTGCLVFAVPLALIGLQPWPQVEAASWWWVVAYGLGWLLVATIGTQWAVTHMEAGRASVLIILELVTAVLTATWIGGEHMTPTEVLGGLLILSAAVIEARREGVAPTSVAAR